MNNYRSLLLELSSSLTTSDLQELKFLCGDVIPAGRAEKITRAFELFSALEQLNMLSEENRDFLASKLIAINRNDLRNKLLGIQGDQNSEPKRPSTVILTTSLDNRPVSDTLLHDLVEELSTSWKMLGRHLGVPEGALTNIDAEHRRVVEKGMAMFGEWKQRKVNGATVKALREALEKLGRRDLSEKVRDFVLNEQETLMTAAAMEMGRPVEERQQFPGLNELRPALPRVPPLTSFTSGYREPQEQSESDHIPSTAAPASQNYPSTDSTRVPRPSGTADSLSRDSASGMRFTGQDSTDHGPETATRTGVQVESSLRPQLSSDGCFLDPEKYEPVKLLGSGGFAKVYLVIKRDTGKRMACKMCDLGVNHRDTQKQTNAVLAEVRTLSALKHRYIVEFFYSEETRSTMLLFLEYMEGGSVEELLRHKGALQESVVRKFTWQILTAVDFLHNNGIIHKDIKGGNILLDRPQTNIKLADFGICTVMDKLKTATGGLVTKNNVASFHWTSPELLAAKGFGRNTDIWSVGCTVVEMLTTKPPLFNENLDMIQRMYKITHLEVEPPPDCSSVAYGFLKRCLCSSDARASAAELLETDPYVKYPFEDSE